MFENSAQIIPGALTVAVTSGKGGVGKTSTAVALATALADGGRDVIVIDGDLDGPNVHIVADVTDRTLAPDQEQLMVTLPTSPYGFRVASPVSITDQVPGARVTATDLIGLVRFAAPAQVVIVDLPPGWTDHHEAFCHTLPDLVITVAAPTVASISDHRRHLRAWTKEWKATLKALREKDKRRKLTLPEAPTVMAVETMALFTGIPTTGGDPVTVRRLDAVAAEKVAELVNPVVSIPSAATLRDSADGPEIAHLAEQVVKLLPED